MPQEKISALRKGDCIPLIIEDVAFGGQGVGRYKDLVVFVPFTVDGDEGIVEVAEVKKNFIRGTMSSLTKSSPYRSTPLCRAYGICGGCQYQHISYDHQLTLKGKQVRDAFTRIGKMRDAPLMNAVASPHPWHYRGKAEVHVYKDKNQKAVVGFTRAASHDIEDIEDCEIVDSSINEAMKRLRLKVRAGREKKIDRREILWSGEAQEEGLRDPVSRKIKGQELLIPRHGFYQANQYLAESLLNAVLDLCALTGAETVIDAYCGSGFFSAFLAPQTRMFYGIEFAADAVSAAHGNLKAAGVDQALFYEGDVGEVLMKVFVKARQRVDCLVLDPPRIGLGSEVLSAITKLKPFRIVYVSCNPSTMARDCRFLADHGYVLKALQPFDMFPQTSHIEVVGLLEQGDHAS
ncbi:MAG: 23S rRNA (uracil(1939)-C(5))-methyltransferase RlmD [Syntrophus sp. SKADARSKE-3]|nr:23S rRNA (uracil(1939)-C(5))-methyltransferase RlmD [Syntrophus sp. SKADARSKE-3]